MLFNFDEIEIIKPIKTNTIMFQSFATPISFNLYRRQIALTCNHCLHPAHHLASVGKGQHERKKAHKTENI